MLIGIGGPSRAGKTTLARLLQEAFEDAGRNVIVVHQDEHVVAEEALPMIRDKRDWEVPESIDWATLTGVVRRAQHFADIVIVEGLFCFNDHRLNALMDIKLFVEIDRELFVHRKKEDLRWGSEPEPDWYIDHIWNAYLKFGQSNREEMDFILDGTTYFEMEQLLANLNSNS